MCPGFTSALVRGGSEGWSKSGPRTGPADGPRWPAGGPEIAPNWSGFSGPGVPTNLASAHFRRWDTEPTGGATARCSLVSVGKKRLIGMIAARNDPKMTVPFRGTGTPPGARTWAAFAATETAVKNPTAHQDSGGLHGVNQDGGVDDDGNQQVQLGALRLGPFWSTHPVGGGPAWPICGPVMDHVDRCPWTKIWTSLHQGWSTLVRAADSSADLRTHRLRGFPFPACVGHRRQLSPKGAHLASS